MKRSRWIALAALAVAVLVAGGLALADDEYSYGPGYGPGMMGGGYGPGGMGGGWGGMGYGMGMGPAFRQLPADKQEQLRKLQTTTMQAMVAMMTDMQSKADALHDAMSKFPIDQAAAKKAHDGMRQMQDQMFALHLSQIAQIQQIVGKETWESLQSQSWGPGRGGPGMMGPGGTRSGALVTSR